MGRAEKNHLRITDISISREHAELTISKDGKLYIRDVRSKFGTLVLVKTPELLLTSVDQLSVFQIGRSVFLFNSSKQMTGSIGKALCNKLSSKKSKQPKSPNKHKREDKYKESEKESEDAEMILELEVEKLQKVNDSDFYLDEEFYERMANEYNKKQNPPILDHSEIRIEEAQANKTEIEDDTIRDEEDEDEGLNPLAQTSDGRNYNLAKLLARAPTNTEIPEKLRELTLPANHQEEEKASPRSISIDNLEIRIDRIAPRFTVTQDVPKPSIRSSLIKDDSEVLEVKNHG